MGPGFPALVCRDVCDVGLVVESYSRYEGQDILLHLHDDLRGSALWKQWSLHIVIGQLTNQSINQQTYSKSFSA